MPVLTVPSHHLKHYCSPRTSVESTGKPHSPATEELSRVEGMGALTSLGVQGRHSKRRPGCLSELLRQFSVEDADTRRRSGAGDPN